MLKFSFNIGIHSFKKIYGYLIHCFNTHFSFYVFSANDLLLVIYFILILDYRNDVKQKANLSDFIIWVQKQVVKQRRQLTTTTHLAQDLLMNIQCNGSSRNFVKETRVLNMRSVVTGHGNWQWPVERITEAPKTTQEVVQEFSINHSMVIQHLKQIGKVKRFNKWVPHELTKNQKSHHFEMWSFSYSAQQ